MTPELIPMHVELYLRCIENPHFSLHGGADAARVFVVDMERRLQGISPENRSLLIMQANGYTKREIAENLRCGVNTVTFKIRKLDLLPRTWEHPVAVN